MTSRRSTTCSSAHFDRQAALLVRRLRDNRGWLPHSSASRGAEVGYTAFRRVTINSPAITVTGAGRAPLRRFTASQRRGIGGRLIRGSDIGLQAIGIGLSWRVGRARYYARFDFSHSESCGGR